MGAFSGFGKAMEKYNADPAGYEAKKKEILDSYAQTELPAGYSWSIDQEGNLNGITPSVQDSGGFFDNWLNPLALIAAPFTGGSSLFLSGLAGEAAKNQAPAPLQPVYGGQPTVPPAPYTPPDSATTPQANVNQQILDAIQAMNGLATQQGNAYQNTLLGLGQNVQAMTNTGQQLRDTLSQFGGSLTGALGQNNQAITELQNLLAQGSTGTNAQLQQLIASLDQSGQQSQRGISELNAGLQNILGQQASMTNVASGQSELLKELISFQKTQSETAAPWQEAVRKQAEAGLALMPQQLDLQRQAQDYFKNVLPMESQLADLTLQQLQRGGRATPEQESLIDQYTNQALAGGTLGIEENRRRALEQLPDFATQRGLRGLNPRTGEMDTPIADVASDVIGQSLVDQGDLISSLQQQASQAKLNFPLYSQSLFGQQALQQQQLMQSARQFQQNLSNQAFQSRLGAANSPIESGLGMLSARPGTFDLTQLDIGSRLAAGQANAAKRGQDIGMLGQAIGGVGTLGLGAALAFCWVAERLYGKSSWKTHLVRTWLLSRPTWWFTKCYQKFGQRLAQSHLAMIVLRPWFDHLVSRAWDEVVACP